jgi:hypothetical protein
MCEVPTEYPTLMITVTDNPRFVNGRLASTDRKAVLARIDKWLKEKMNERSLSSGTVPKEAARRTAR